MPQGLLSRSLELRLILVRRKESPSPPTTLGHTPAVSSSRPCPCPPAAPSRPPCKQSCAPHAAVQCRSITTATTVGYGNIVPQTPKGRLWASIYMFITPLLIVSFFTSSITAHMVLSNFPEVKAAVSR